jgi:predicted nucleic acid-binding protein
MASSVLVDTGFLVALLSRRDANHRWASEQATRHPPPWLTCESVLSEALHLLGARGGVPLAELLRRGALGVSFELVAELEATLKLLLKYRELPMSLADACLVRMSEQLSDPILLTTDADFRIYRRHSRQVVPCALSD